MTRPAKEKREVVLGAPDSLITPPAGLPLVAKLDKLLGITRTMGPNQLSLLELGESPTRMHTRLASGWVRLVEVVPRQAGRAEL